MGRNEGPTVVSCIFFDFFGTLVDYSASRTEQGFHDTYALLRDLGVRLEYEQFLDEWAAEAARLDDATRENNREFAMEDVAHAFLKRVRQRPPSDSTVDRFVDVYLAEWNQAVSYPADVPEILHTLAGRFRLAVVTNTHKADLVPRHLAAMGIAGIFEVVVTSLKVGWRKPHPAIFSESLRQMRAAASEVVFVGDDYVADYLGSTAAGIRALLLDPTRRYAIPEERRLYALREVVEKVAAGSP